MLEHWTTPEFDQDWLPVWGEVKDPWGGAPFLVHSKTTDNDHFVNEGNRWGSEVELVVVGSTVPELGRVPCHLPELGITGPGKDNFWGCSKDGILESGLGSI